MNTVLAQTSANVRKSIPNENEVGFSSLYLAGGATKERRALIFFAPPFPQGAYVTSAILRLYGRAAFTGSHTLHVKRITGEWADTLVTWNNQPASTATHEATLAFSGLVDGDELAIDVTDLLGDVAAGGDYYGLILSLPSDTDASASGAIYSPDGPVADFKPALDITWRTAPYGPTGLSPSNGNAVPVDNPTLGWQFTDPTTEATQAESQVQLADEPTFASPVYDSGRVTNTEQSWDLTGEYSVSEDEVLYHRVMVWDDAGIASPWSDIHQFTKKSQGTLTILNPPGTGIVKDTTPPIIWTFTGRFHDRAEVILWEQKPNHEHMVEVWRMVERIKHDMIDTDTFAVTIPREVHLHRGRLYRVDVRAWDSEHRESIIGHPSHVSDSVTFSYEKDGTPDPPTDLAAAPIRVAGVDAPGLRITWERADAPDFWTISVDDDEQYNLIPVLDLEQPDGSYAFDWWNGVEDHTYTIEVEAVVVDAGDKKHSSSPGIDVTVEVRGKWLVHLPTGDAIVLADTDQSSLDVGESATTYELPGSRMPVRITESIRGYEGTVSGVLLNGSQRKTAEDMKGSLAEFRYIERKVNIPVRLAETSISPRASTSNKDWWLASFTIFQTDEFSIDVLGG